MPKHGGSSREPAQGPQRRTDVAGVLSDVREVQRVLQQAVREALLVHKKLGYPIATWEGGKVVWIPPERIVVEG